MKLAKILMASLLATSLVLGTQAAESKAKVKPYTLETCVVTGEKLGGMGEAYTFTHEDREIKLCCKGCVKAFKKEPAKYVKLIEEQEKKAKDKKKS